MSFTGPHRENGLRVGPNRARLFAFSSSPQVYQSGVIVAGVEGNDVLDWSYVFEPEQALMLATCLASPSLWACSSEPGQEDSACAEPRRIAVVGGGGGTLPMALVAAPKLHSNVTCDMVEIHGAVIRVATDYFGIGEHKDRINVHHTDGMEFLLSAPDASYDAVLIDICGQYPLLYLT